MCNVLYGGGDGLQSIRLIFLALIKIGFLKDTPPEKFKDIPTVDVYQDDWKAQLKDQDEAWIITPLHYFPGGKRIHRKVSGGDTWNNRDQKEKNCEQATWHVRKFKFVESTNEQQATNDGTGLKNYTMTEYLPKEPKPQYALCLITVDNKKSAHDKPPSNSHQQPKIMEIDNTDANTGDKVETSQSHKPVQRGGTLQNATGNYNLPFLERILRELIKHHPFADILKVLYQIESEKLPAQSTEAPVGNTGKRGRYTYTNTMEAGTSRQGQEQVRVEDPDNLFVNLNVNSTEGMELSSYNQNTIAPGAGTSNHGTTVPENIGSNDIYGNLNPNNNDTTLDGQIYWDENIGDFVWQP